MSQQQQIEREGRADEDHLSRFIPYNAYRHNAISRIYCGGQVPSSLRCHRPWLLHQTIPNTSTVHLRFKRSFAMIRCPFSSASPAASLCVTGRVTLRHRIYRNQTAPMYLYFEQTAATFSNPARPRGDQCLPAPAHRHIHTVYRIHTV